MSGYTEACASAAANTNIVATGGIGTKGITGKYEEVFWADSDFEFASVTAMKDQSNWDAGVAAANLVYLGKGKFEDQSEEAQFFTDEALNIREEQSPATKVVRMQLVTCACSHAELRKMQGKSGRIFIRTSKGFAIGRLMEDDAIRGRELSSLIVGQRTVPTDEQPVEYSVIDFTFADNAGDELNPAEVKIDFLFSEVDQVYPVKAVASSVSSDGSTLSATLTITEDCGSDALENVALADVQAVDENGNTLTVASLTEGSPGVYSIGITTALTTAYVSFDGIRDVNSAGTLYYMGQVKVAV